MSVRKHARQMSDRVQTECTAAWRRPLLLLLVLMLCIAWGLTYAPVSSAQSADDAAAAEEHVRTGTAAVDDAKESADGGPSLLTVFVERRWQVLQQVMEHIKLAGLALALAITVGVSTGITLTRTPHLATPVLGVASVIQTIPSLALLALMIPLLGVGVVPAVAALFLYALLPIMRNTYTAIDEVDRAIIEVGRGMGMTNFQILLKVEIPLCVPVVMAGIRTSTVICVGIATLCTFIGAGGLGESIMDGMQSAGSTLIFVGVIPAIGLALALDGLMALAQKILTPRGLRIRE